MSKDNKDKPPVAPDPPPGTEAAVRAEMDGEANYVNIDRLNLANELKNAGLSAELPPWTVEDLDNEPVILKICHFGTGLVKAGMATAREDVRQECSWPRIQDLPQYANIEINSRTANQAIVGCESGTKVDIDGAIRANRYRSDGLWYVCPPQVLRGIELRLRHFGHPFITIMEGEYAEALRKRLGATRDKGVPDFARPEIDRYMVLQSMISARGKVKVGREVIDLGKMDTYQLRKWFEDNLLPKADLRGQVPPKYRPEEREEFFRNAYAGQNADLLDVFVKAHHEMRQTRNAEILARGGDFRLGAVWDDDDDPVEPYKPTVDPVDLTKLKLGPLRKLFRDSFFPQVNLRQFKPPPDERGKEEYITARYRDFNNQFLIELMEREAECREVEPQVLAEKGSDFVAGASA